MATYTTAATGAPITSPAVAGRWVEVISGASVGQPPPGGPFSFGVARVYPDGYIEYMHRGWDQAGNSLPASSVSLAPYEAVRTRTQLSQGSGRQPVRCRTWVKTLQLDAAATDLITTDVIRGLVSATERGESEFLLRSRSPGLTFSSLRAEPLVPDVTINDMVHKSRPARRNVNGRLRAVFHPPLDRGRGVDVRFERRSDGSVYRSSEDKLNMGGASQSSPSNEDQIDILVDFQCEQLLVRLRFIGEDEGAGGGPGWLPQRVWLEVVGSDGLRRQREETSGHVILDYRAGHDVSGGRFAEAVLSVQGPRIDHRYRLLWDLPRDERIPKRDELADLRQVSQGAEPQVVSGGGRSVCPRLPLRMPKQGQRSRAAVGDPKPPLLPVRVRPRSQRTYLLRHQRLVKGSIGEQKVQIRTGFDRHRLQAPRLLGLSEGR